MFLSLNYDIEAISIGKGTTQKQKQNVLKKEELKRKWIRSQRKRIFTKRKFKGLGLIHFLKQS